MQADTTEQEQTIQAEPETETLNANPAPVPQVEENDDFFSDDPDVIFKREYAKLDTVPLRAPQGTHWPFIFLTLALFCSFLVGTIFALITYPTTTIQITPLTKQATFTTQLDVSTRPLAPVTVRRSETTPTTGIGHQNARRATGTVTFYNGLFTQQSIGSGTIFTGRDGIKVKTLEAATIPPSDPSATPPQPGYTSVTASAIQEGAVGNIAAYDINATVIDGVSVKNTSPFQNGRDARTYKAVAQRDLDTLTTHLKTQLAQQTPQAFVLRSGESLHLITCHYAESANHPTGEEANTVTMQATDICNGVAYNQDELETKADALFAQRTRPGAQFQLIGSVSVHLASVRPVTVTYSGYWVYILSQSYQQFLAEQIAGMTPKQAHSYLLSTGFITQATVDQPLPKDPGHIHFAILMS